MRGTRTCNLNRLYRTMCAASQERVLSPLFFVICTQSLGDVAVVHTSNAHISRFPPSYGLACPASSIHWLMSPS